MKKNLSKLWRSGFVILLVLCMVIGMTPAVAFAAETGETIHYVSLGASNTNGYGLYGYLPEDIMDAPVPTFKQTENVYGYQKAPREGYPSLVKAALEDAGYSVSLDQLAISSMRAEELHVLLDNSYYGDAYTRWRFYDENDDGTCEGWFAQAEPGGLNVLRQTYQDAISNADLVTVDVGVNNFGVYAINRITSGGRMYDADLSTVFSEADLALYNQYKAEITAVVVEEVGQETSELLDLVVDTFAYALTGYCIHFDASLKAIYELNPDVQVVVLSIQNLLSGITAEINGEEIPFGDIYGAVVDMANTYTAAGSPYCGQYVYAYAGENGHATTFLNEIQNYNGVPAALTRNMTDCFDIYDNNLWIRSRVQQLYVKYLKSAAPDYVECDDSYLDENSETSLYCFMAAVSQGAVKVAGTPLLDFIANGKNGQLGDYQSYYRVYENALLSAYDVVAKIMQAGARTTKIDLGVLSSDEYGDAQDAIMAYIFNSALTAITNSVANNAVDTSFAVDKAYLENSLYATIMAMGVRFDIGNSFYAHPNAEGHQKIAASVLSALENRTSGETVAMKIALNYILEYYDEVYALAYDYGVEAGYVEPGDNSVQAVASAMKTINPATVFSDYIMNEDSYYVALGDGSAYAKYSDTYVDLLADELGIAYKNLGTEGTIEDALTIVADNTAEITKADLITVGYGNATFANAAIKTLMDALMKGESVTYDWASLITADGAAYVEDALDDVYATMVEQGLDEVSVGKTDAATAVTMAVETYAYNAMVYSLYLPEVLNAIHDVNPEALIVIVGMSNPFEGTSIDIQGVTMALGEYVDYLVDIADVHGIAYCMMTGNAIYVEAPDAESTVTGKTLGIYDLLGMYYDPTLDCMPTEDGHEYIKNQILGALDVKIARLGDVNFDGEIDIRDAKLVASHYNEAVDFHTKQLDVADVNSDGVVDIRDANLIVSFYNSLIAGFPAETA